jgi:hypothetical protein
MSGFLIDRTSYAYHTSWTERRKIDSDFDLNSRLSWTRKLLSWTVRVRKPLYVLELLAIPEERTFYGEIVGIWE